MGDDAECPGGTPCGAKFNKTPTKFFFFKASPDESTVEVVFSFLAGTMGDGAECKMRLPRPLRGLATTDRHPATLHYAG